MTSTTPINWPELKAAGYRVERVVGTFGWHSPCWYAYSVKDQSFSGSKHHSKGQAMRACRDHKDATS